MKLLNINIITITISLILTFFVFNVLSWVNTFFSLQETHFIYQTTSFCFLFTFFIFLFFPKSVGFIYRIYNYSFFTELLSVLKNPNFKTFRRTLLYLCVFYVISYEPSVGTFTNKFWISLIFAVSLARIFVVYPSMLIFILVFILDQSKY